MPFHNPISNASFAVSINKETMQYAINTIGFTEGGGN